jgi:uncharacterized protein (DUF433 family)
MIIPTQIEHVVVSDPEILGGTPCFLGTRVPLATFLDYVEAGYSLDRFLRGYSSVKREHAKVVLEWLSDESRKTVGLVVAS